ncbi:MAG: HU family DNA-binding protein [Lysobacter sp.]|nr:HU family DNA-binding protein [Lysobacter sp.]
MALTKAEMAERLFDEVGLNKREAKEFVDAFFDALREALEQGRQVKLSGLKERVEAYSGGEHAGSGQ